MISDKAEEREGILPGVDTETPTGKLRNKRGKEEEKEADK